MSTFKVGDRVRVISKAHVTYGMEGEVVEVRPLDAVAVVRIPGAPSGAPDGNWWTSEGNLELLPKFKVGDKVRVTSKAHVTYGMEGEVVEVRRDMVSVAGWWFHPDGLELIEGSKPEDYNPDDCDEPLNPKARQMGNISAWLNYAERYLRRADEDNEFDPTKLWTPGEAEVESLRERLHTQAENLRHLAEERDRLKFQAMLLLSKEDAWPKDAVEAVQARDAKIQTLESQLGEWMSEGEKQRQRRLRAEAALSDLGPRYSFGEVCVIVAGMAIGNWLLLSAFGL